jgi:toxin CcdB
MAKFDIYQTPYPGAPLVLDIQSDFLEHLATRAVVPLEPAGTSQDALLTRLQPVVDVKGTAFVLNMLEISNLPASELKTPLLSLAGTHRQLVLDALDFLTHGF